MSSRAGRLDPVRTTASTAVSTTTRAAAARPTPATARISVARQAKQQRRGYAAAVLRGLARSNQGWPAEQIQATLRSSLTPLGVRLAPDVLRGLAADIAAGRPVALPG